MDIHNNIFLCMNLRYKFSSVSGVYKILQPIGLKTKAALAYTYIFLFSFSWIKFHFHYYKRIFNNFIVFFHLYFCFSSFLVNSIFIIIYELSTISSSTSIVSFWMYGCWEWKETPIYTGKCSKSCQYFT